MRTKTPTVVLFSCALGDCLLKSVFCSQSSHSLLQRLSLQGFAHVVRTCDKQNMANIHKAGPMFSKMSSRLQHHSSQADQAGSSYGSNH